MVIMNSEPRTGADSLSSPSPWVETQRAMARSSWGAPGTGGMVTGHTGAGATLLYTGGHIPLLLTATDCQDVMKPCMHEHAHSLPVAGHRMLPCCHAAMDRYQVTCNWGLRRHATVTIALSRRDCKYVHFCTFINNIANGRIFIIYFFITCYVTKILCIYP